MDTPVCSVCLNSNILCSGCDQRLKDGKISQTEIDVSRSLFRLSEKNKSLEGVKLLKAIDSDLLILIAGKGDAGKIVGKKGSVVKTLANEFKKSVKVIEESDFNSFVKEILHPAAVTGINTVYGKDTEKYRVRISLKQRKLSIPKENFSKLVNDIFGKEAELIIED